MSQKQKRTDRRRQQAREDILQVAKDLVLTKGIANVTLTSIASELELTKAALYYYFKSKDDLLFEVVYAAMSAEAATIEQAVAAADNGSEAIASIIRSVANHYGEQLDQFRLVYMAGQVGASLQMRPEFFERIRPLNGAMYGRAEELISRDQQAGRFPMGLDPRRTAFLAHCAVIGVLTLEGMIDAGGDSPLIHSHADMVEDLVRTHTSSFTAS